MKYGVNERAYRLWRRRERRLWPKGRMPKDYDHSDTTRLSVALRDAERALFSRFGPNVKPDWEAPLRVLFPIALVGVIVYGVIVAAGLLGWFR